MLRLVDLVPAAEQPTFAPNRSLTHSRSIRNGLASCVTWEECAGPRLVCTVWSSAVCSMNKSQSLSLLDLFHVRPFLRLSDDGLMFHPCEEANCVHLFNYRYCNDDAVDSRPRPACRRPFSRPAETLCDAGPMETCALASSHC